MRYASIRDIDISNGKGIGISVWTQGCSIRCPGCHNSSIWDFNGGQEWSTEEFNALRQLLKRTYITRLSILGGEPLLPQNFSDLAAILMYTKQQRPDIKTWCWTGYTFEQLQKKYGISSDADFQTKGDFRNILNNLDYLIDGPFILEKKDLTLKWRGSSNQRVIDMQATLQQSIPIGQIIPPIVLDVDNK